MVTVRTLNTMATRFHDGPATNTDTVQPARSQESLVESDDVLLFGPFRMSMRGRWLRRGHADLPLSSRAFDILVALVSRAGTIVGARELFEIVWPDVVVEASNLRVHIVALRKALGDGVDGARFVINVPGRGYMFACPVRTESKTLTSANPQPHQRLPMVPQPLYGRSDTLEKLTATILSKRFVSVIGPAGVGKTTVSLAAADALSSQFGSDGVCFLDLSLQNDPTFALAALLSIAPCPFDLSNTQSAITRFLSDKRVLLFLDNCEHVIDSLAPLVARIFREAPSVHLLVTSREVLRAEGEHVEFLSPLSHATSSTDYQRLSPAVELFMERAAASGWISSIDETETASAMEICRRLDGLPIAIELVASHVSTLGMLGLTEIIEQDEFLTLRGRRSACSRHQTLEALLDWSFDLLSDEEQRFLLKLSKFAGAFTLEAVRSLYAQPESEGVRTARLLASLADKSLLQVSRSSTTSYYKLLHILRVYCARRTSKPQDCRLRIVKDTAEHEGGSPDHLNAIATVPFGQAKPNGICSELSALHPITGQNQYGALSGQQA